MITMTAVDYINDIIRKHGECIIETTLNYPIDGHTYTRFIFHFEDGAHLVEFIRKDAKLELTFTDDVTKDVINYTAIDLKEVNCMSSDDRVLHTFYYYDGELVYHKMGRKRQ